MTIYDLLSNESLTIKTNSMRSERISYKQALERVERRRQATAKRRLQRPDIRFD